MKVEGVRVHVKVHDKLKYIYHAVNLRPELGVSTTPFRPETMENALKGKLWDLDSFQIA